MKNNFITPILAAMLSMAGGVSCTDIVPTSYDKGVSLDATAMTFIGDGESKVLKITSKSPWSIDLGEVSWLTASKTSGDATEKIILTASKNPSTADARTAKLSIASGDHTQTLEITQEKFMSRLTLDRNGETFFVEDNLTPSETVELQIKSNVQWSVSAPQWITLSQNSGTGDATITATIDNRLVKEEISRGAITFSSGDLEQTFTVERPCSFANTFIITAPGQYSIPAAKPDGTVFENAASATWLFESKSGMIAKDVSYSEGKINFTVNEIGGYAGIILRDGSSNIIWSYLIWCTERPEDITVGADVYQDRNIGAWSTNLPISAFGNKSDESAYGCYFQWGRKDAFPGPNTATGIATPDGKRETTPFREATLGIVFNTEIAPGFDISEVSPTTVLYNTEHPWLSSNKQFDTADPELKTLWTDNGKSVYDPCPAGYKVPSAQQTENMMNTLGGWTKTEPFSGSKQSYSRIYKSGDVEFSVPSTGRREWGCLVASGRSAGYWTSTFSETDASGKNDPRFAYRNYDFKPLFDTKKNVDVTNRGYAVRCVKIK